MHTTTNVCKKLQLQLYIYSSNSSMSNHEGKWVLLVPYSFLILVNSTKKKSKCIQNTHTQIYMIQKHISFDTLKRILDLILFNCYLASPRLTFDHFWGVSLTNSTLISAITQLWSDINENLTARFGRYKPPGDLWVKTVESALINIKVVGLSFW